MTYLMAEIRVQRHEAGLPTPDPRVLTSCLPGYYDRGFLTCITDITDIVTALTFLYIPVEWSVCAWSALSLAVSPTF